MVESLLVFAVLLGLAILLGIIYYFARFFKPFNRYVAVNAGAKRVSSALRGVGEVGNALINDKKRINN